MKIRFLLPVLLAAAAAVLSSARAEDKPLSLEKLVIALKPDKNPDQMMEERKTLSEFLSAKIGKPVEVVIPLSSTAIFLGFGNGTIDLGYLSATDLLNAREEVADVLLAGEINGKTSYQSYWVALKDKPYTKVEDLKGKPIAFAAKTSTSGFMIPLLDLRKKSLISEKGDPEEFFGKGNVWYGSGYVSAIERVLSGEVEAAAVSYYVLDQDKHLTADQRAKLKKVTEQGPVPTHLIAIRSSINAQDRAVIAAAIESLNEEPNTRLRDKVFTSKLVKVDKEKHLAPLKEAMKLIGGGPR